MKNAEFKAMRSDHDDLIDKLKPFNPRFVGEDHQVDTYFNVAEGRLKLREGNIENALIYYNREDITGTKVSHVILYSHAPSNNLKEILIAVHGVKVVVSKKRKIYFVDNVKFHFDEVDNLGAFVEVEAIEQDDNRGTERISEQSTFYSNLFGILPHEYLPSSYSDMLLTKKENV